MSERLPLLMDSRWVGDAYGDLNAIRSRLFLKSEMQPRTLWPEWAELCASRYWDGYPAALISERPWRPE